MYMETESSRSTFAENFRQCCGESYYWLSYEKTRKLPIFQAADNACSELYDQIGEQLGEKRKWIDEFDAAKNRVQGLEEPYIYQQGFQDCIYLLRWLGML